MTLSSEGSSMTSPENSTGGGCRVLDCQEGRWGVIWNPENLTPRYDVRSFCMTSYLRGRQARCPIPVVLNPSIAPPLAATALGILIATEGRVQRPGNLPRRFGRFLPSWTEGRTGTR